MIQYISYRVLMGCIVLLSVTLLGFFMFHFLGDPVSQHVNVETTLMEREVIRENLGLNDPIIVQYGRFVMAALHGKLGISYAQNRPVIDIVKERLPATVELGICSSILAFGLAIPLGILLASKPFRFYSRAALNISLIGISVPTFLIGITFIIVFAVWLDWLPAFGRGTTRSIGWWTTGLVTVSGLKSLILPATALAFYPLTLMLRLVRAEMLDVMKSDYIYFARARGISERAIIYHHAIKNILIPVTTVGGLQIGSVLAFSVVTESVFQWPGIGLMFIEAVHNVDIPVIAAYLLITGLIFVTINLIVDLLYFVFDPRIRTGQFAD